ncbi:MAG: hypothetical protein U0822_13840 [Anaerolineae bacterium]
MFDCWVWERRREGHTDFEHTIRMDKRDAEDAERRAADILRRLGAGDGSNREVVDDFMRRVDRRADELRRDDNNRRR